MVQEHDVCGLKRHVSHFTLVGYAVPYGPDFVASAVPFSRYLCTITETMEQYRHDLD